MLESPLLPQTRSLIAGEWTDEGEGTLLRVKNPATGELLAEIPEAGARDARRAIESARASMALVPDPGRRALYLNRIHELLLENREELARIITLEQGKPLRESHIEVEYTAAFFRFFAGRTDLLDPHPFAVPNSPLRWVVHHRPAGVVAMITPWNLPLAMLGKKFAAALLAGCGVVSKPAPETPLSAIALFALAERAGIPSGLVNLVVGPAEPIGVELCSHPAVRVISFTGSTEVGKLLIRRSADSVKRVSLELGGNAPFIVFEDADLELAVESLMVNKFRCAGQTCICANRVFVHETLASELLMRLGDKLPKLVVGNGMDPATDIGPLIDPSAWEKVDSLVKDALSKGAKLAHGGNPDRPRGSDWGAFYPPTLIMGANEGMRLFHEEIFGPVIAVATFREDEEVLARANSSQHGLAGYVFTKDAARGTRMVTKLQCGHVGLNSSSGPTPSAPFGGMKASGIGREGGAEGLMEYLETQTVVEGI